MADSADKQTPSTDPKSPDKTGPVRPPVLEGTARPNSDAKPSAASAAGKPAAATTNKPEPAKPAAPTSLRKPIEPPQDHGSPWLAGLLGGAIGLGAAYGLAWFGLWPVPAQAPQPADPRLAQFSTAIPQLESATAAAQTGLSALESRIAGIETDIAALPGADSDATGDALADQLAALTARVEALSIAPPNGATAPADTNQEAIAALQSQLAAMEASISGAEAQLADTQSQVSALNDAASAASQSQAARLPLVFSGLESAFDSGRAYETELAALRQAMPGTTIPEVIAGSAASGQPRPDDVARRLDAAIPAMLAGRPANAEANWQDGAMDWVRGIVAMRPTGEIEGDSPDAQIARLEAAVARRDFIAAETALTALPAGMQSAAGDVAADIARLAAAQAFLADLRIAALSAENGA